MRRLFNFRWIGSPLFLDDLLRRVSATQIEENVQRKSHLIGSQLQSDYYFRQRWEHFHISARIALWTTSHLFQQKIRYCAMNKFHPHPDSGQTLFSRYFRQPILHSCLLLKNKHTFKNYEYIYKHVSWCECANALCSNNFQSNVCLLFKRAVCQRQHWRCHRSQQLLRQNMFYR